MVGLFALMMEAVQTSETSVNSHQSTRRYNPEDSHLHSHRRGILKSHLTLFCPFELLQKNINVVIKLFSLYGYGPVLNILENFM
jgi:hypothetical protein